MEYYFHQKFRIGWLTLITEFAQEMNFIKYLEGLVTKVSLGYSIKLDLIQNYELNTL